MSLAGSTQGCVPPFPTPWSSDARAVGDSTAASASLALFFCWSFFTFLAISFSVGSRPSFFVRLVVAFWMAVADTPAAACVCKGVCAEVASHATACSNIFSLHTPTLPLCAPPPTHPAALVYYYCPGQPSIPLLSPGHWVFVVRSFVAGRAS